MKEDGKGGGCVGEDEKLQKLCIKWCCLEHRKETSATKGVRTKLIVHN